MCKQCWRPKHGGLCNMVLVSDGRLQRTVHADRVDNGDLTADIKDGRVKVINRFIPKKASAKKKARKN